MAKRKVEIIGGEERLVFAREWGYIVLSENDPQVNNLIDEGQRRGKESVKNVLGVLSGRERCLWINKVEETRVMTDEDIEGRDLLVGCSEEFRQVMGFAHFSIQVKSSVEGMDCFLEYGRRGGRRSRREGFDSLLKRKIVLVNGQWSHLVMPLLLVQLAVIAGQEGRLDKNEFFGLFSKLDREAVRQYWSQEGVLTDCGYGYEDVAGRQA